MKLNKDILNKRKLFEEYLSTLVNDDNSLNKAINYSLLAGGKRIRPLLCIYACEAMGGKIEDALPYAAAIEAVHTYSLIHDDLPAMDDDDLRRGIPTCHKKFGEAMAILAGDALLTLAFELIANSNQSAESRGFACGILARAAGMNGMVLGQVLDMEGQSTLEALLVMYEKKTAALLLAAAALGAVAAGGHGSEFDGYCHGVGLAFQIKDDILDVYGDENITGKSAYSDVSKGKKTALSFLSVDDAKSLIEDYTKQAIDSLGFLEDKAAPLRDIAIFLTGREV